MSMTQRDLIEVFGDACDVGSAALFVGAGLSKGAGLPDWSQLLMAPCAETDVPAMEDLPLRAEFILRDGRYSRERLQQHMLDSLHARGVQPTESHHLLARLPVDQIWTTNYDPLLERACEDAVVIASDDHVRRLGTTKRAVIKMHGSISGSGAKPQWDSTPVITRADYETYEDRHRRLWALLRAVYLSKTILFIGFSFSDPNIEVLQRLARRHGLAASDRHTAIMIRPATGDSDVRRHDLRVRDLEASGVHVHEIDGPEAIPGLLRALVRRTRKPQVFISGSTQDGALDEDGNFTACCNAVAAALAPRTEWAVHSLGGLAGWYTTKELARIRQAEATYDAARLVLHWRRKDERPPSTMDARLGTSIFSHLDQDDLRRSVLDESRAVLVIGGGSRSAEEIEWATGFGAGVVPMAASGGAARAYWEQHRAVPPDLGGRPTDPDEWDRLGGDPVVAARAAVRLLAQAMYVR